MNKIIKIAMALILVLVVFVISTWITLACRVERAIEQIEIEQERRVE